MSPAWPARTQSPTARPPTDRMRAPRSRPASEAGVSGKTWLTRSSSSETKRVERPRPTYWLSP